MRLLFELSIFLIIGWCGQKCVNGALPNQIRIAAVFDQGGDRKHELAFRYGVQRVNRDPNILRNQKLVPEIIKIPPGNRYV